MSSIAAIAIGSQSNDFTLKRNIAPNSTKMDGIDALKAQALTKRNAAILAAKREYAAALREIRALQRKLGLKPMGRPRKRLPDGDPNLKASVVAREILREGKAMTLPELTLEVQHRGCRPLDHPRDVAKAVNRGLLYSGREFKKDERGRWLGIYERVKEAGD